MNFLSSLGEALTAIDHFLVEQARELDQPTKAALIEAAGRVSPVDKTVGFAEALYGVRADLSDDGLVLAGQVIEFATRYAWHGLTQDARGERMVAAIRRQLGEEHPTGGEWPAPETDPTPVGAAVPATPFQPMTPTA